MSKKMIIAALIGSVVSFLLGWLVFGMLLDPYYRSNMIEYPGLYRSEEEMRLPAIFLSQLAMCGMIAYIYDRLGNIRTFGSGLLHGIIIFMLIYGSVDLMFWSSMNLMPYKVYIVDVIVNGVYGGLISGVIAFILGYGASKS